MLSFSGMNTFTISKTTFYLTPFSRYTLFFLSSTEGLPLLRPLWFEFPHILDIPNEVESFMWGDSILVAPKLSGPSFHRDRDFYDQKEIEKKIYPVDIYLPNKDSEGNLLVWYDSLSMRGETFLGQLPTKYLSIKEVQMFFKGGSIIPIKLHYQKLCLLRVQYLPVALDVYLDHNS